MSTQSENGPEQARQHEKAPDDAWTPPPVDAAPHLPASPHHPQQPGPVGYGPAQMVQPRNPVLFALASLLIGGLGTMLAGRVGRGLVILCVMLFNGLLLLIPFIRLLFIPVALGLWVFSGFDGYRTAQKWNTAHGIIS